MATAASISREKQFPRIPAIEAFSEPLLLKKSYQQLSIGQRVVLKAIYAIPLEGDEEKAIWAALNGKGVYDDLGFLVRTTGEVAFPTEESKDITVICGRRWGKSHEISSLMVVYEALCGGHKAYVGARQDPVILQVSQDLDTAKKCLRQFILDHLLESPIGTRELGDLKKSVTADTIRLGTALITVAPPTIKIRGQAVPVCAMDELAVWPKDREAASPDFEVQRAVSPATMQFKFPKILKTSTPWTKEGLLWEAAQMKQAGLLMRHQIVLSAPTGLSGNPHASRAFLREERTKDAEAFRREFLAEFFDSITGFLSASLLRTTVTNGQSRRAPEPGRLYIATLDPAFRRDAFAFAIGHLEKGVWVLDHLESWRGTPAAPESPTRVLSSVARTCKAYGVRLVVSDQYHLESLQELAQGHGLVIEPCPMTAMVKNTMWGEFQSLLTQGKLKLLDHTDLLAELASLEKTLSPTGTVSISGKRDDLAMVVALNVHKCLQMGEPRASAEELRKQIPLSKQVKMRIEKRNRQPKGSGLWWLNP